MSTEFTIALILGAAVVWLAIWMFAQRPDTSIQKLIYDHRYHDAVAEAERHLAKAPQDHASRLHRAEALKLLGRFQDARTAYGEIVETDPRDAAAREGLALTLAHESKDLVEARRIMEETIQGFPEIQEFQALTLAYILLRDGHVEDALRVFEDNAVLLQTRFKDDYTDPDPLLAETLYLFAVLSKAAGDHAQAKELFSQVAEWAPGSIFASWAANQAASLS